MSVYICFVPIVLRRQGVAFPQKAAIVAAYLPGAVHPDAKGVFPLLYLFGTEQQVVTGKVECGGTILGTDVISAFEAGKRIELSDSCAVGLPYFKAVCPLLGDDETTVCSDRQVRSGLYQDLPVRNAPYAFQDFTLFTGFGKADELVVQLAFLLFGPTTNTCQ